MKRKLLLFGNGLGMALDPNHFLLSNSLNHVWDLEGFLTPEQKELILKCINHDRAPQGEEELDLLHLAVASCETLLQIGTGQVHWLTNDGQLFPEKTAHYIHKVATHLHNYDDELPEDFINPLINFVKKTKSHVATLNYDKLLYNPFIDNNIFNGYDGYLVDGMTINKGFSEDNLERLYDHDYGYYLHLHGSPLFVNKDDIITKLSRYDLGLDTNIIGRHIVLTHVKHKPEVIAASEVLSAYWNYLRFAISEVDEVILFGYSGQDKHLNTLIRPYLKGITLRIIEWKGSKNYNNRHLFWKSEFETNIELIHLENILNFHDW